MGAEAPAPVVIPVHAAPKKVPCPKCGKHGRRKRTFARTARTVAYKAGASGELRFYPDVVRCRLTKMASLPRSHVFHGLGQLLSSGKAHDSLGAFSFKDQHLQGLGKTMKRSLQSAIPALAACLVLNLAVFAAIAMNWPAYLRNYRLNENPDAVHYVLLGHNLFLHGTYSRCEGPPYISDMLRTPVYPVFAGALDLLGGAGAIYAAQIALHMGSCLLVALIGARMLGRRTGWIAGLLLATDLSMVASNFEAMSEALFNFLMLGSCYCLFTRLRAAGRGAVAWPLAAGSLLGLAAITRPTALYLVVVFSGAYLLAALPRRHVARAARSIALVALALAIPVGAWTIRNYVACGTASFSFNQYVNLNYFFGAGGYQVARGIPRQEAQDAIAREFALPSYETAQNDFATGISPAEIRDRLQKSWPRVVARYPKALALSAVLGIVKATFSHVTGRLASLVGRPWIAPETNALIRGRPEAFRRLGQNGFGLSAAFVWQMIHAALLTPLAVVGTVFMLRDRRRRTTGLILLAFVAYWYLTIVLFGVDAYWRCRSPLVPFLCLLTGFSLDRLMRTRKQNPRAATTSG
jgi:Dolichyl-phosphate-mannose-protein mannosyltransferase